MYDEYLEESARVIQAMKDEASKEQQKREFFQSEYNLLQDKVQELSQQFDETMSKSDLENKYKEEQQRREAEALQLKAKELELKLVEREKKCNELNTELIKARSDQDIFKASLKEKELEISS